MDCECAFWFTPTCIHTCIHELICRLDHLSRSAGLATWMCDPTWCMSWDSYARFPRIQSICSHVCVFAYMCTCACMNTYAYICITVCVCIYIYIAPHARGFLLAECFRARTLELTCICTICTASWMICLGSFSVGWLLFGAVLPVYACTREYVCVHVSWNIYTFAYHVFTYISYMHVYWNIYTFAYYVFTYISHIFISGGCWRKLSVFPLHNHFVVLLFPYRSV